MSRKSGAIQYESAVCRRQKCGFSLRIKHFLRNGAGDGNLTATLPPTHSRVTNTGEKQLAPVNVTGKCHTVKGPIGYGRGAARRGIFDAGNDADNLSTKVVHASETRTTGHCDHAGRHRRPAPRVHRDA